MSEQRFTTDYSDFIQNDKTFIKRGNERLTYKEIADLLNEQQATIEQLKAQLREKEEDEKLYANEILELREINKEWLQCKNLGGDY